MEPEMSGAKSHDESSAAYVRELSDEALVEMLVHGHAPGLRFLDVRDEVLRRLAR